MNNWKLRSTITGTSADDLVEVNGYLQLSYTSDVSMAFVPFGDKFAAGLRTSASDNFGPVSNQVPGICNGTFTHTGAGSATVSATSLTGGGSGATFTYTFLADGTLSTIVAASGGSGYLVGDKLRITTGASHGSQVIEFRVVDGSNAVIRYAVATHDAGGPSFPFPVHRVRINNSEERTVHILDNRSSQVFPKPQDKLLDKYPDAAAAYGLRLLRSAYLGPAIRVRKDGAGVPGTPEKDIYFDSQGNLDTTALLDFIGDKSARVKIWYDQSGNGNDASQTANAPQPTLVSNGVIETVNGKPALKFDGTLDSLSIDSSDLYGQDRLDAYLHYQTSQARLIMFEDPDSIGNYSFVPADTQTGTTLEGNYDIDGTSPTLYVNGVQSNLVDGTNTRDELHTFMVTNGASHSNGAVVVHEAAGTQDWTDFSISSYTNYEFNGKMTEMVLYNTDQSANRENIEKDMALHSGAFQVEDAPLLDAYGGAHAAYSLRKLNSDYTGAAIRVVSVTGSSPYDEQDIGFDADGNLDEAALKAFAQNNCVIKTWYDQSGNGNDVTQTSVTDSPRIMYSSGALTTVAGRPAVLFEGTSDAFPFDNTGLDVGNLSSFAVMKYSNLDNQQMGLGLSGATGDKRWYAPYLNGGNLNYGYKNDSTKIKTTADTNNNLHTMIAGATQGDVEAFLNGTSAGTTPLVTGISSAAGIGNLGGSFHMKGFIQEVVVYSSDQSERREGIERNISNHYDL